MECAVNLNRKGGRMAIKVNDESRDHLLPAEMETIYCVAPQRFP
jgi:hypothetical protein